MESGGRSSPSVQHLMPYVWHDVYRNIGALANDVVDRYSIWTVTDLISSVCFR
ncbi:unnamed protein product [Penicillium roqueforti FM164]|uniref:Uncharacterized protein n=1 Tax=Penicillium roqueforti (strain FM164) TaxID=1365484 RepID=W6QP89_PENRF|nr:unnamed protein product [Penicillium roqueforti FM164]